MVKKLEVNDLRISFRTNSGILEAVRGISFDLEEGETLAIVGESGSGKSVTSRAIMGILAKNAIVEGGEIFYDGLDLLQIPEDVFHQLRGNNISMIFQDPLSSLNPIMRIGQQITEAMIANNKARRKDAKRNVNRIQKAIIESCLKADSNSKIKEQMRTYDGYLNVGNRMASKYFDAVSAVETIKRRGDAALIEAQSTSMNRVQEEIKETLGDFNRIYNPLTIPEHDKEVREIQELLKANAKEKNLDQVKANKSKLVDALTRLSERLEKVLEQKEIDFIAMAYKMSQSSEEELLKGFNEAKNQQYIEEFEAGFLDDFKKTIREGVDYEDQRARNAVKEADQAVGQALAALEDDFSINYLKNHADELAKKVEATINSLSLHRDSLATTFRSSLQRQIKNYEIESKELRQEEAKHEERSETKGSQTTQEKLEVIRKNIFRLFSRLEKDYEARMANRRDADWHANELVLYLENQTRTHAYKVDKSLAKSRAIAIMQEVGIDDARRRFTQYPFEFSGGMRQRIVIAIALSSNPDILICDEPTTALDVTIQAQILDLIKNLKSKRNLSVIFITHDLGVVANIADKIAVMYAGKIVEIGSVNEVFYEPAHPYTWALLSSMPDLETKEKLESIPGVPPNMVRAPKGDAFAERNRYALAIDYEQHPPFFDITETHKAATWLLHPKAEKVEPPKIVTERIKRSLNRGGENA
jgi:oligopeptide transport system ATP-binding protein